MAKTNPREARKRRHLHVRLKLQGTGERPRLCIYRSVNNIYAQVIDDVRGETLAAVSTLTEGVKDQLSGRNKTARAELVGEAIARVAKERGISKVAFDRGGFKYHGRVKALAEAARKAGLEF